MKKLFLIIVALLIASPSAFATAKDKECYTIGSNLIKQLSGCYLEESSSDNADYTCDNGYVFIYKSTGTTLLILDDARGKLTVGESPEACLIELRDEYGVAIIPRRLIPKGNSRKSLYLLFKEKFLSGSCPPSWQDAYGRCKAGWDS